MSQVEGGGPSPCWAAAQSSWSREPAITWRVPVRPTRSSSLRGPGNVRARGALGPSGCCGWFPGRMQHSPRPPGCLTPTNSPPLCGAPTVLLSGAWGQRGCSVGRGVQNCPRRGHGGVVEGESTWQRGEVVWVWGAGPGAAPLWTVCPSPCWPQWRRPQVSLKSRFVSRQRQDVWGGVLWGLDPKAALSG